MRPHRCTCHARHLRTSSCPSDARHHSDRARRRTSGLGVAWRPLAHRQSRVIRAKYAVLGRLFAGLVLLLVLAGVLLATGALLGIVR